MNCSLSNCLCCFCFNDSPYFGSNNEKENINWIEEGIIDKMDLLRKKYGLNYIVIFIVRVLFMLTIFGILVFGPEHFRNMIITLFYTTHGHSDENSLSLTKRQMLNEISFYDSSLCCLIFSIILCLMVVVFTKLNFRLKSFLTMCCFIGTILSISIYIFSYNMYIEDNY